MENNYVHCLYSESSVGESDEWSVSFSYYLNDGCPDKHIQTALMKLIEQRLEAIDEAHESNEDICHYVRWLIAVNPNTPPAVLDALLDHSSAVILERIAENPQAQPATLARLAKHEEGAIRLAVAENPNTPLDILWMLAADGSPDVRFRLAESYHLPEEMLQFLADDENPYVANRACRTLSRIERSKMQCQIHEFPQTAESAFWLRMNKKGN